MVALRLLRQFARDDAAPVDDEDLSRFDVTDELRADDVQRAGFRGDEIGIVAASEHQRAEAPGVARRDQAVVEQDGEAVCPLDL